MPRPESGERKAAGAVESPVKTAFVTLVALAGCQAGVADPVAPAPTPAAPPLTVPVTPMTVAAIAAPSGEAVAPWTLTASDGSGLQLTRVDAKAVVQGPLAFTELHLYFHNAEDRTREGTFAITLPSGAAVSRFAMETDGKWQEAEVVDKATARRAYDDFLHRRQDPALLEKAAGNQFSAKVFPIPAKADKHIVISFSQELAGRAYALPLRGLPKTERVDVVLTASSPDGKPHDQKLAERNWQPDHDFIAKVPPTAAAVMAGEYVAGALAFAPSTQAVHELPQEITLLVDTSASRALGFAGYVKSIHALVAALGAASVDVIAFDQDSEHIYDGPAAGYDGDAKLVARGAAGASSLSQVVAMLAPIAHRRVVVVTDGVMTAGATTPELVAAIAKLPIDRLDVVLAGGIRDERLAGSIVRAGLPHAGDVFDLDRGVDGVIAGLGEPVSTDIAIDIPGATWVYPRHIPAARPGSTLMVYAKLASPSRAIEVSIGGVRRTIGLGLATPALVERAVAGAEIEELENKLEAAPTDQALREDIAARSVKARVISSQTAMLVLERDADYERYKIERTALADILVVGPNGLEQTHRTSFIAKADPAKADAALQLAKSQAERARARAQLGQAQLARSEAIAQARQAGTLGSTRGTSESFESLTGTGDISSGFDEANIYGGLLGNEVGEAQGAYGFGRAGFGPGGVGTGWGTIGTGRYGTIGRGSGTGAGYGVGGGRGGMRGRAANIPTVTYGQPTVTGELDRAIIRRYIRRNQNRIQYCYEKQLLAQPSISGNVIVRFAIDRSGLVLSSAATGFDATVAACVADVVKSIEFPHPPGVVQISYPITFRPIALDAAPAPPPRVDAPPQAPDDDSSTEDGNEDRGAAPLTGKLADVMAALHAGKLDKANEIAKAWHDDAPGDVLALIAYGEALEAKHDLARAARIYGSIIDLFSSRADLRRFAGERLERLGEIARPLAIDSYRRAVADRPDHLTGHRLLAYALLRSGDHAGAFDAILAGIDQKYPEGRFLGGDRVLAEDAGMIAASYVAHGGDRAAVAKRLAAHSLEIATAPSTRFILYWETDDNDVDFHIRDAHHGHAWYQHKHLHSGGDLYADVTTGYGPECFTIQGKPSAGPYKLSLNYFSQGPMGYGMGLVEIQRFDGTNLAFEDRPYVIMTDRAFVDLGTYTP